MVSMECCVGCRATVPAVEGPSHAYMRSAPGCWERYCSFEDCKATLVGEEAIGVVQDLVDSFTVEHPTSPERRNIQSVAVHLMSLCAGLERGVGGRERRRRIGSWVGRDFPVLVPVPGRFSVTVSDVATAAVSERTVMVEHLASWSAWSAHHDTVRSWLDGDP